ncbi:Ion channel [Planctomycetes bacterium Poly30]|uniref:Ion channel n=1 Tax=Saltatorellus ferox TaxID=2528018 RepID=A0A518EX37_9BACT|nr:Ion channel [Planctomycetes bacterium Poly30]
MMTDLFLSLLSRRAFDVSADQLIVGAIGTVVVAVCAVLHYEVMRTASWALPRLRIRRQARVLGVMFAMLVAHIAEVWIFGLTYWVMDGWPEFGRLEGPVDEGALDFIYFSVTSFTTLGFGDIVPTGAIRILCGAEALAGLGLITWSASFAFLEMQRDWAEFRRPSK